MPEETAFWSLVQLIETKIPQGFFGASLWRCHAEIEVLKALLSRRSPRVLETLEGGGLPLELFSTQWFLCLFATDLPLETAMRVWDLVCHSHKPAPVGDGNSVDGDCTGDGLAIVLSGSLALFSMLRPQVELAPDPGVLSRALSAGVAAVEPGPRSDRFIREMHAQLAWLTEQMPLRELRSAACTKVRPHVCTSWSPLVGLSAARCCHCH